MRYFFHLMDEKEILRDTLGVEVEHLTDVEAAAIDIIREFRLQQAGRGRELLGWRLAVTDSGGAVVLLLPLSTSE
jgi:hypothetical protein